MASEKAQIQFKTEIGEETYECDITIVATIDKGVFSIDIEEGGYAIMEDVSFANLEDDKFNLHLGGRPTGR